MLKKKKSMAAEIENEELFQIKGFSMLRLDTAASESPTATATAASSSASASISNSVPAKSLKRRSPSDSPVLPQPNAKKEKLSLPPTPLLRRCVSDSGTVTPPPDSSIKPSGAVSASASTRNLNSKAVFRRSVSDVIPSPALKSISGSDGDNDYDDDDDSPNSKRLRRIKDRLREMSQWFQQVMLNDEDDPAAEETADQVAEEQDHQENEATPTDQLEDDCEAKFAESVRVEKMEECLVLHFRCQCGAPYEFLLTGESCYYKLM